MSGVVTVIQNPTGTASEENIVTKVPTVAREFIPENRAANTIQNISTAATAAARSALPEGENVFLDVAFTSGVNKVIEHKLGRAYTDWTHTRIRGTYVSVIEVAQNSAALDALQITLVSNANCTCNIRVR